MTARTTDQPEENTPHQVTTAFDFLRSDEGLIELAFHICPLIGELKRGYYLIDTYGHRMVYAQTLNDVIRCLDDNSIAKTMLVKEQLGRLRMFPSEHACLMVCGKRRIGRISIEKDYAPSGIIEKCFPKNASEMKWDFLQDQFDLVG